MTPTRDARQAATRGARAAPDRLPEEPCRAASAGRDMGLSTRARGKPRRTVEAQGAHGRGGAGAGTSAPEARRPERHRLGGAGAGVVDVGEPIDTTTHPTNAAPAACPMRRRPSMADRNKTTKKVTAAKATAPTNKARGSRKTAPPAPAPAPKPPKDVLNVTGRPRLGKGGLEALVLEHMTEHPGVEFTSTELSHKLNRSNGAIQNALEKFTGQGKVTRTSERPRRYRYAKGKTASRTTRKKKAV